MVVGLGNPGRDYEFTRHNAGFLTLDHIAVEENTDIKKLKYKALIGDTVISGHRCLLVKPQTFMNLSGESVRELIDYYKVDEETELIVIYDDISLDVGQLRIRKKGSAGGHNGIKSIIQHLGHDVFPRIKMGVGEKPKGYDLADYVLGHFSKQERGIMDESAVMATKAIELMVIDEIGEAMNLYNKKVKQAE